MTRIINLEKKQTHDLAFLCCSAALTSLESDYTKMVQSGTAAELQAQAYIISITGPIVENHLSGVLKWKITCFYRASLFVSNVYMPLYHAAKYTVYHAHC